MARLLPPQYISRMLSKTLNPYSLFLASKSPRRQELLKALNIAFEICSSDADEQFPEELEQNEVAIYIAKQKADAIDLKKFPDNALIISADTIVCIANQILGKPQNSQQASEMLNTLSGKTHKVITGICLTSKQKQLTFSVATEVEFKTLTEAEISYYIENYAPYDKAGSYGIQEWIGYIGVKRIEGSYFNVMGLPVHALYEALMNF